MTFTLLLDLDDTLLSTNLDAFLSGYFKKLTGHMADMVPPEKFLHALLRSTGVMYASTQVDRTLEQVFYQQFYPALDVTDLAGLTTHLEDFYDRVFPTLASLTSPRPEAVDLVKYAFSQGWNVAIATDPLFPRKAILERLRWAGLDSAKYPFILISDFHNFHFAKASVSYYPEFLARMGWQDEPVLMVGDSFDRDVMPSRQAGVPVYWLTEDASSQPDSGPAGWYGDLRNYLETTNLVDLKVNYRYPQALLAFLRATPAVLHGMLLRMEVGKLSTRPADGEWSVLEIVSHMRDVDGEVNLTRAETILREENAFINGQATDHWVEERNYNSGDGQAALASFVTQRLKLVDLLGNLDQAGWERRARHTFLGPTSLLELVGIMVDHDRLHLNQVLTTARAINPSSLL